MVAKITGQQMENVEQPPFYEIEVVKATATAIVEHEQNRHSNRNGNGYKSFCGIHRVQWTDFEDAISRSFDKGNRQVMKNLPSSSNTIAATGRRKSRQLKTGKPSMTALCVRKQLKQRKKLRSTPTRA
jgi:hypothetical protein